MFNNKRPPGVSFILRARNEEAYLKEAIESLKPLTITHEIVIILHKCTDQSKAIAQAAQMAGQPIRIIETERALSRAGYETVITPHDHIASLVSFYNWSFSKATYNWMFKWDGDFKASPELIEFLNALDTDLRIPRRYVIPCQMTPDVINKEQYLFNCLVTYKKHIFWEVPVFTDGSDDVWITPMIYTIPHTILKEYWKSPPWFNGLDTTLEAKHKKLIEICGVEPLGASRAQCKDCDPCFYKVQEHQRDLEAAGIYIFK